MMRIAFTICAFYSWVRGEDTLAIIDAILAVAWSQPTGLRSWLGWDDAVSRAEDERRD